MRRCLHTQWEVQVVQILQAERCSPEPAAVREVPDLKMASAIREGVQRVRVLHPERARLRDHVEG